MAMLAIITLFNRSFHSSAVKLDWSAIDRTPLQIVGSLGGARVD
jgi:hypothetical protein